MTSSCPNIYVFAAGDKVSAKSATELVEWLQKGFGFDSKDETLERYMFLFSERTLMSIQRIVRFDTPENFVEDLQKCGLISDVVKAD